jgi:hypothetical protein
MVRKKKKHTHTYTTCVSFVVFHLYWELTKQKQKSEQNRKAQLKINKVKQIRIVDKLNKKVLSRDSIN